MPDRSFGFKRFLISNTPFLVSETRRFFKY